MSEWPPPLPPPLRRAMELAWDSCRAGSFGIGASITRRDGVEVATGRNRILERSPGDDVLAGSSLAHAELNALAKLGYRDHEGDDLHLWTTLQPCIQCLGAIRLSPVRRVTVLAPDPLFRGIERIAEVNEFLARRWPRIEQRPVDGWAVLALLLPHHLGVFWSATVPAWTTALPALTALTRRLAGDGTLTDLAVEGAQLDAVAAHLWADLAPCVDEVASCGRTGRIAG